MDTLQGDAEGVGGGRVASCMREDLSTSTHTTTLMRQRAMRSM